MLNDVIFNNEKSAYNEWNIVLTKAEIPLPTPKTSTVDVKGADGLLDLSEVLTGDVQYNNRQLKLTFEMMDDTDYYNLISNIGNYLHGKVITVTLTNDECYYYTGRATINQWECSKRKGIIVITVDCEPYKYLTIDTVRTVSVTGQTKTVTLINSRKRVCPIFDVTGTISVTVDNVKYELAEGQQQQLINFILIEGNNTIQVSGNGTVVITYRQGAL